jgi:hypothetical protein
MCLSSQICRRNKQEEHGPGPPGQKDETLLKKYVKWKGLGKAQVEALNTNPSTTIKTWWEKSSLTVITQWLGCPELLQ